MKANRKFVESREAVSAVIGVILMVAITVAIAAVVYVWVTSFGGGGTPAPSISMDQIAGAGSGVNFTIRSASTNARWSDLRIVIDDTLYSHNKTAAGMFTNLKNNEWTNKSAAGTNIDTIGAGDKLIIKSSGSLVGKTLQIIHIPSNSVIVTKTIY